MTTTPTEHRYRSSRLDLGWWEWGSPDAPLLLLIHGGRDHGRSWDDVAGAFCDRWRVVAPDLRGHGRSAWADGGAYQIEDFVYDIDRLAAALGVSAERPATVVGHSLGGNIALRWAGLYPALVRRLVAIEGLGSSRAAEAEQAAVAIDVRLRGWIDARRRREERALPVYPDLAAAVARMRAVHPRFGADLAGRLAAHGTRPVPGGISFAYDPLLLSWPVVELSPTQKDVLWAAVACPVLLVYGRESWATDPSTDDRAALFRDARVSLYADAGHWVHHDRRDAFVAEVDAFI